MMRGTRETGFGHVPVAGWAVTGGGARRKEGMRLGFRNAEPTAALRQPQITYPFKRQMFLESSHRVRP